MSNFTYNANAVTVLAKFKDLGNVPAVNRKQALAIIRELLAKLTLDGSSSPVACPLTTALETVVNVNQLSQSDSAAVLNAFHRLIGLCN